MYVTHLYVLETSRISSPVNKKQQQNNNNKKSKQDIYTKWISYALS